jgi:UDP-glucose 4-epimerase
VLAQDLCRYYKRLRVLITGGAGFIGSNLTRQLVELGSSVTLVDSLIPEYGGNLFNLADIDGDVKLNICDLRDQYSLSHLVKDKDILFNLAGQTSHIDSMENPFIDTDINYTAQLSLLENCRKNNPDVRVIYASTRQIYGRPQYLPVDEDHPIVPVDVNGINKFSAETLHRLYSDVYGLRTCSLRLTNTYGPRMRVKDSRQTFLGVWVKAAVTKKQFHVFGDGNQLRDFNEVGDCVDALLLAGMIDDPGGRCFNLGSSEVTSLRNLAGLVSELGAGCEYTVVPFPSSRKLIDIGDYYSNHSRFTQLTGWVPKTALRDGLRVTLDYYRKNIHHYL